MLFYKGNAFAAGFFFLFCISICCRMKKPESLQKARIFFGKGQRDVAAHAVPDQHAILEAFGLDNGMHGAGQAFHAHIINRFRTAAARQVGQEYLVLLLQVFFLKMPNGAVFAKAMHQHYSVARTYTLVL